MRCQATLRTLGAESLGHCKLEPCKRAQTDSSCPFQQGQEGNGNQETGLHQIPNLLAPSPWIFSYQRFLRKKKKTKQKTTVLGFIPLSLGLSGHSARLESLGEFWREISKKSSLDDLRSSETQHCVCVLCAPPPRVS